MSEAAAGRDTTGPRQSFPDADRAPARVMLVLPTTTYRAAAFLEAAARLGVETVVASEEASSLSTYMDGRMLTLDLRAPAEAAIRARAFAAQHRVDAVIGVDEAAVLTAAHVAAALGLPHHSIDAVARTRDKRLLRQALGVAGVRQPAWLEAATGDDPVAVAARVEAELGWPCVVKPVHLAASRGVIRADDPSGLGTAASRVGAMLAADGDCGAPPWPLLVEQFVPGPEVAVEGTVDAGHFTPIAVFDKPDPLDGPFFEETLYVTPSRHPREVVEAVLSATAAAVTALGLRQGPVHAELRWDAGPVVLEVAARSIGGLCSGALRLPEHRALEEVLLAQALGLLLPVGDPYERLPSGVLMLPTPSAGLLAEVSGLEEARRVPGVVRASVDIPLGSRLVPLPEGGRYLGFVIAHGESPEAVEGSLRDAWRSITVTVA